MTDAVKLLTEAEAQDIWNKTPLVGVQMLRERGLIAPKPVDALLIEARNVVGDYAARTKGYENYEAPYRQGKRDSDSEVQIALAALKRGMEMRPPLTREALVDAFIKARIAPDSLSAPEFQRLHAALTKEQS